ncbi:MAG: hypothetical protein H6742_14300 [Alphaproteobacteria bacterium]|nr:hypothetical protein [Alphaproteobacteria bacterium]
MTWDELKASFTGNAAAAYDATLGRLSAAIQATPAAFEAKVTSFFALLAECKANLDRIQARLPNPPRTQADANDIARYAEMKSLYDALVLGISRNAVQVPQVGIAPAVVIVVGAVGLTVAGVAWAVAAWEYAASLRDQTAFMAQELDARVAASQRGTQLQPTTATPPSAPAPGGGGSGDDDKKGGAWMWLLGIGAAAAAAAFIVPKLGKG